MISACSQENGCRALRVEKGLPAVQHCAGGLLRAASGSMRGAPAFDLTALASSAARPCERRVCAIRDELKSETRYLMKNLSSAMLNSAILKVKGFSCKSCQRLRTISF